MKKFILLAIFLLSTPLFADRGFFIQGRSGALLKIDMTSSVYNNAPQVKGPSLADIPETIALEDYKTSFLPLLKNDLEKTFFNNSYQFNEESQSFTLTADILQSFSGFLLKQEIYRNIRKEQKRIIKNYHFDRKRNIYSLQTELSEEDQVFISQMARRIILRVILLNNNQLNEMPTGPGTSGMPTPHRFPRVFEPKTKANLDIHFAWGFRFANDLSLSFSINLTNFIMPSLEIMLKYNFDLNHPDIFFEPYVGGLIYGGFIDGFPIGLSAVGGMDFFPKHNIDQSKNLYLSAEMRMGTVLYSQVYFDTGNNSEGIWKKLAWLAEGGFYFNTGYRWDRIFK
ncbi:MAG: hypothetical protein MJB14_00395 [Spirochaetes bacterium]|nr:hypothetical protein [Spirochaetota bacterium]